MPAKNNYSPIDAAKKIFENRQRLTSSEQIKIAALNLAKLAKKNTEVAELLVSARNRFLNYPGLLQLLAQHQPQLIDKLIANSIARINPELQQELRSIAAKKQNDGDGFAREINQLIANFTRLQVSPGRTDAAIQNNEFIQLQDGKAVIEQDGQIIPVVTRKTLNFNQKLCSAGSSSKRELILLDPQDSILCALYNYVKRKIKKEDSVDVILEKITRLTRLCFLESNPEKFIQEQLSAGTQIIGLEQFIENRQGVCRHHGLLNAYFISRLIQDNVLNGEIMHHRQDFGTDGAHTWNIFHNKATNKYYSVDSLWDSIICLTDNPGAADELYQHQVEATIIKRLAESQASSSHNQAIINKIRAIREYIEINPSEFKVGQFLFFKGGVPTDLDNGEQRRLPHPVANIYTLTSIKNNPVSIYNSIMQCAINAIKNPGTKEYPLTTLFYENIVNDKIIPKEIILGSGCELGS